MAGRRTAGSGREESYLLSLVTNRPSRLADKTRFERQYGRDYDCDFITDSVCARARNHIPPPPKNNFKTQGLILRSFAGLSYTRILRIFKSRNFLMLPNPIVLLFFHRNYFNFHSLANLAKNYIQPSLRLKIISKHNSQFFRPFAGLLQIPNPFRILVSVLSEFSFIRNRFNFYRLAKLTKNYAQLSPRLKMILRHVSGFFRLFTSLSSCEFPSPESFSPINLFF